MENVTRNRLRGDEPHLFKPGQSGNPGGRKKSDPNFVVLCRTHTIAALATLVKLMNDKKVPAGVRATCAINILDRAHGRPVQQVLDVTPLAGDRNIDPVEAARRIAFAIGLADEAIDKASTTETIDQEPG